MQFFRLIRKVFAVSRHFWPYLAPWGHYGGPGQDPVFGTPYFGGYLGQIWAKLPIFGPQNAHRVAPITPKMENKVSTAPEITTRIKIFTNFYKILLLSAFIQKFEILGGRPPPRGVKKGTVLYAILQGDSRVVIQVSFRD